MLGLLGAATGVSTLAGGLIALALRRHIHLLLGFSAGAVLAVAMLDLLPEALRLGASDLAGVTFCVGAGFMLWLLLDRMTPQSKPPGEAGGGWRLGPASLTLHSLLDGLAIGVALQASEPLGLVVAGGVIAHDLSDGANTVNLSLLSGGVGSAFLWLLADAVAPALGLGASRLVHIPGQALSTLLALFSGAFLYIGGAKLTSESYRRHPHPSTSFATAVGFAAICGVLWLEAR